MQLTRGYLKATKTPDSGPVVPEPISINLAVLALGVDRKTVFNLIRGGDLPAHKEFGRWHIWPEDLKRFRRTHERRSRSETHQQLFVAKGV